MDYQGLPPVDLSCSPASPTPRSPALTEALGAGGLRPRCRAAARPIPAPAGDTLTRRAPRLRRCARPSATATSRSPHCSLSWNGACWPFRHPLDYLGSRRRRRRRRRPGHLGRRGARAQGQRPAADRDLRRRRFPDGRHRAVDRGALPHSAADRGRQQPLLLQRRAAPGARRAHAQPAGREPLDRPAHLRARYRHCGAGARAGRARASARCTSIDESARRLRARRSPRSKAARSPWSMCGSSRATRAAMTRRDDAESMASNARRPARHPAVCRRHICGDDSSSGSRRRTARSPRSTTSRFSVRPGEFLSVIGPSGCGKSTLFNIIGGLLDRATRARVTRRRARRSRGPHKSIGMVFQEESTFPWRTVLENVAFPLEIAGMPKAERARARAPFHLAGRARRLREPLSRRAVGRHAPARLASRARSPPSRRSC